MQTNIGRREFLQLAAAGAAVHFGGPCILAAGTRWDRSSLVSPGCRRSKVKVAKIYVGVQGSHYPNPDLDVKKEVQSYEAEFAKLKDEFSDVEFVVDGLISSADQLSQWRDKLKEVDGILAIHLTLWTMPIIE